MSFPIIDLIAGMIFIYFLLAIVNNSCLELFSSLLKWKAIMLSSWMKKTLGPSVYLSDDCLPTGVAETEASPYIEAKDFTRTLVMHLFQNETPGLPCAPSRLSELIKCSSFPEPLKKILRNFAVKSAAETTQVNTAFNLPHFETQIEDWFRVRMNYLTTGYKRKSMIFTFVFATVITLALNIDTLQLAAHLYGNRETRELLANRSDELSKLQTVENVGANRAADSLTSASQLVSSPDELSRPGITGIVLLPLGWPDRVLSEKPFSFGGLLKKAGGLFMTIMAIGLGAPFWFEVLGKIANLRSSLKPLEK